MITTPTIRSPQRPEGTRIRNSTALALALVGIVGYVLWLGSGVLVRDGNWVAVDFHVYYQAAHVLTQRQDIYSAGISPPYVYPPLLAILVLPLAGLPVTTATIIWKVLQHLCLIAAGGLLVSLLPRGVRTLAAGILLFGWLLAPVHDEILLGESNSLVLLLVVGTIWLTARGVEREKWEGHGTETEGRGDRLMAAAGTLLAVAASIKVLPLVLLAYFWWRGPRRVAITAAVGFVALQFASLLVTSSTLSYWVVEFPALFGQAFPYLDNQSFNAAMSRALMPTDPSLPNMQIADSDLIRSLLTWVANLVALAVLILTLRSVPNPESSEEKEKYRVTLLLETGLVLLTIHLVSGSTWMHHLIDLCVPVCGLLGAWWLSRANGQASAARTLYVFGVIGFVLFLLLRGPDDWLSLLGGLATSSPLLAWLISNSGLWAVLALWVMLAVSLRGLWMPYQSSRRAALAAK